MIGFQVLLRYASQTQCRPLLLPCLDTTLRRLSLQHQHHRRPRQRRSQEPYVSSSQIPILSVIYGAFALGNAFYKSWKHLTRPCPQLPSHLPNIPEAVMPRVLVLSGAVSRCLASCYILFSNTFRRPSGDHESNLFIVLTVSSRHDHRPYDDYALDYTPKFCTSRCEKANELKIC